jgi:hypothetical protein
VSVKLISFQTLAQELDDFDPSQFFADPAYIHAYAILFDHEPRSSSPDASTYLDRFIIACQLLDTLLWAHSWPNHSSIKDKIPRTVPPAHSEKFDNLMRDLSSWDSVMQNISRLPLRQEQSSNHALENQGGTESVAVPSNQDLGEKTFHTALKNFGHAHMHGHKRRDHQILEHFYSVAFVLRWFSMVNFSL